MSTGIAAVAADAPRFGQVHHLAQHRQATIRLVRAIPKAVVKLANIGAREISHAIMAENWCYV
jgi:hypothetical protein